MFVATPLVLAFTAHKWFWRIGILKRLRPGGQAIKAQIVTTPAGATFDDFITTARQGDKVVVTHHLLGVAEDFVDSLWDVFVLSAVISVVFAIAIALYTSPTQPMPPVPSTGALQAQSGQPLSQPGLEDVLGRVAASYLLPGTSSVALILVCVQGRNVYKQVFKYRGVI
jgi:hypothetical protein